MERIIIKFKMISVDNAHKLFIFDKIYFQFNPECSIVSPLTTTTSSVTTIIPPVTGKKS